MSGEYRCDIILSPTVRVRYSGKSAGSLRSPKTVWQDGGGGRQNILLCTAISWRASAVPVSVISFGNEQPPFMP